MIEVFTELGLNNLDLEKWMLPQLVGYLTLQGRASSALAPVAHAPASLVLSAICRACSFDSAVLA